MALRNAFADLATSPKQDEQTTKLTSIDTDIGFPSDPAATTDTGTFAIIPFIKRGMQNWTTLLTRLPTLVSGRIPVDGSGVTQPVSGPLTDTQLRATAVPISTNVQLGGGAITATTTRVTTASDSPGVSSLSNIDSDLGAPADAAATSDTGTFAIIPFIKRGMQNWTTLLARIPTLVSGRIPVDGSGVTQPVSGPLTDTQLRATAVPISTNVQLGGGAITATTTRVTTASDSPGVASLSSIAGLSIPAHDYILCTYTGNNLTSVVYRTGGAGGTIVGTLTLAYNVSNQLISVTRS